METIKTKATDIDLIAPKWKIIIVQSETCMIMIDGYEQNGADATATAISRDYDLTVIGTANPDSSGISGMFSLGSMSFPLTIIRGSGMDWHAVVTKDWFPPPGRNAYLYFMKVCGVSPPASASSTLTFA